MKRKREDFDFKKIKGFMIPFVYFILDLIFDTSKIIKEIPSTYFTIFLILVFGFTFMKSFLLKNKKEEAQNIIFLASENDYQSKDTALGFSIFIVGGYFLWYYLVDNIHVNFSILVMLLFLLAVSSSKLSKTAFFQINENEIYYENNKEKRVFEISQIEEVKVSKNEMIIYKKDNSKELLPFLEFNKTDYIEIKRWFHRCLPNSTVLKFD